MYERMNEKAKPKRLGLLITHPVTFRRLAGAA